MNGIILAAGRGSRMKGLTENQPKCFSLLHGKRLIDWQLDALRPIARSNIAIIRGYLPDSFTFDTYYFENPRWASSNMLTSLCCAREWLRNEDCIVSYSDIVYSPKTVERLAKAPADIAITYDPNWLRLWKMRFENPLSDAETFKLNDRGALIEIGERTTDYNDIQGQYMGLLKFTPRGWATVESLLTELPQEVVDRMDMTKLLRRLLESGHEVEAVRIEEPWYEVDSQSDLDCYQALPSLF